MDGARILLISFAVIVATLCATVICAAITVRVVQEITR